MRLEPGLFGEAPTAKPVCSGTGSLQASPSKGSQPCCRNGSHNRWVNEYYGSLQYLSASASGLCSLSLPDATRTHTEHSVVRFVLQNSKSAYACLSLQFVIGTVVHLELASQVLLRSNSVTRESGRSEELALTVAARCHRRNSALVPDDDEAALNSSSAFGDISNSPVWNAAWGTA